MRNPKQVLIFLYRINKEIEYCIFYRKKEKFYQGLSGGVEDNEELIDTVKREVYEETKIKVNNILKLDTISSIPGINVNKEFNYKNNIYIVYEYAFGIKINNEKIKLSDEHEKYIWVNFNEAINLLKYDSNKTALFELNERLIHNEVINNWTSSGIGYDLAKLLSKDYKLILVGIN